MNKKVFIVGLVGLTIALIGFIALGAIGFNSENGELVAKENNELREVDNPTNRQNWFMYQRSYPFEKIPEGARRRAWADTLNLSESLAPEGSTASWVSVGPKPTAGAGPGGAVSGRINEIAVSPSNNQIIVVAGSTGGIWRSTNGGTSFAPVSDNQIDVAIGTIAFAPSNANIVYAGMGDIDNGYFGSGVLKSTDAGATWTRVNNSSLPDKVQTASIQVDPTDPNKVYAAVYNSFNAAACPSRPCQGNIGGIYVSTDGGVSWTRTLTGAASDLAIHPTNRQIIYAGLRFGTSNSDPRGLFKSTDGGTNWTNVYNSPFNSDEDSTRDFRVAVTPASPNRVYIYFGSGDGVAQLRLEMSDDAGATFTNRGVINNGSTGLDMGQFGYNTYLEVSPVNSNTVWVGARDFFKSSDAGATFTNLNGSFQPPYPDGNFTESQQKVHTDQQSFAFHPGSESIFYVGNDGGIFKTTDGGSTFASLNSTLSLAQFISVALHPTNGGLSYAGAQDNGTQRRTTGTSGWVEFTATGDGGNFVINAANPSIVYAGSTNGTIFRNTQNGSPSTQALVATAQSFGATGNPPRIDFYAPVVSNGVDNRLYSGSWRLYICSDCDTSINPNWTSPSSMDLTRGGDDVLKAIAVAKSNNNVIYTGSRDGRAMRSTDNGANWTDISAGLPMRTIASITVSNTDPTLVYLTVSGYGTGHVYRSTDSGASWANISNNLPDIPTSAFLIDPRTPTTTLYAGTDVGVFRSTDTGGSWTPFNNGLPPVPIMAFSSQTAGKIQVATYGRGVYELPAQPNVTTKSRADFDGDGKTDMSVFRPSEGNWYLNQSTAGFKVIKWGIASDVLTPGDIDGDNKADTVVFRANATNGEPDFYTLSSQNFTVSGVAWGTTGDVPCVADYDGDGKANYCVWRPSTGDWYVLLPSGTLRHFNFGSSGDKLVPADYDGDGKTDFAVFRPSNNSWYYAKSSDNSIVVSQWGTSGDMPVSADYDGDNKDDIAMFRPSDGTWYIRKSSGGVSYIRFGSNGDIPVPGDYDGDGKDDQAVYRGGDWYLNQSSSGVSFTTFGVSSDKPIPQQYLPQ